MHPRDLHELKNTTNKIYNIRFQVFTAVTMNNTVFWDVAPCGSCYNRRFGGMCFLAVWFSFLVTADGVPSSLLLYTRNISGDMSPEMSDLRRFTLRHMAQDGIQEL
jgi:hypothetical protein